MKKEELKELILKLGYELNDSEFIPDQYRKQNAYIILHADYVEYSEYTEGDDWMSFTSPYEKLEYDEANNKLRRDFNWGFAEVTL